VAVDTDHRLKEPGHRRRRDVLRAGRLEASERLAKVVGIAARDQLCRGAQIALREVPEGTGECDRDDHALPEVEDEDWYARDGEQQRSKPPILEGGAPSHARIVRLKRFA